jgi:hypothetical protein
LPQKEGLFEAVALVDAESEVQDAGCEGYASKLLYTSIYATNLMSDVTYQATDEAHRGSFVVITWGSAL